MLRTKVFLQHLLQPFVRNMLGELLPTSSNCLQGWWSKTNRCNPRVMSFPSVESVVRWVDQESLKKTTPTPLKWLLREISKNIGHAISFFGDLCDVTVQTKRREPLAPKLCPTKTSFFMLMSGHVLFRVWNETMKQAWGPWWLTLQLHRALGHTCGSGLRCFVHCTLPAQFQEILLAHPEFTIMGIKAWFHRILHCPCP